MTSAVYCVTMIRMLASPNSWRVTKQPLKMQHSASLRWTKYYNLCDFQRIVE